MGVQLEEVQYAQTKAHRALAQFCSGQHNLQELPLRENLRKWHSEFFRFTNPDTAPTTTREPAFHSSSPVVLQQLVQVIVEMGPHSSFAVEVSDRSGLTIQLLQRRFQRFSDDWLRRVMNALRKWQIWASKHSPPIPFWNPSAHQLGEYLISADKRGPTVARGIWTQLDWVRRELGGAFPTDSSLLASFRLHTAGHLPTPADEMPPGVFLAITYLSSNTQGAVAMLGGLVVLLAVACLRWQHQARSIVQHLNEQFITGKCLWASLKCKAREELSHGECRVNLVCVSPFSTVSLSCCRQSMSRTPTCAPWSLTSRLTLCHLPQFGSQNHVLW